MTVIKKSKLPWANGESVSVEPPIAVGGRLLVTQEFGGGVSHNGALFYSIDFVPLTGFVDGNGDPNVNIGTGLSGNLSYESSIGIYKDGNPVEKDNSDPSMGRHNLGNYLTISSDKGVSATIMHLRQNSIDATGMTGVVGLTGYREGYHAHISYGASTTTRLYVPEDETYIDKVTLGDGSVHIFEYADSHQAESSPVSYDTALGMVFEGIITRSTINLSDETEPFSTPKGTLIDGKGIFLLGDEDADITAWDSGSHAGKSNNIISGNSGQNEIAGLAGSDAIWAGAGKDVVYGEGPREKTLPNGITFNDTIYAGSDADSVYGGEGDDWIYGDSGESYYALTAQEITVADALGIDTTNDIVSDAQVDFRYGDGSTDGADDLRGESGSDTIFGGAGNDTIYGGGISSLVAGQPIDENDVIFGGIGNDVIFGELGDDTIFGGTDENGLDEDIAVVARLDNPNAPSVFRIEDVDGATKLTHYTLSGGIKSPGSDGTDLLYDIEYVSFGDDTTTYKVSIDLIRNADYVFRGDYFDAENVKAAFGEFGTGLILTNIASLTGSQGDYTFTNTGDGFISVTIATPQVRGGDTAQGGTALRDGNTYKIKADHFKFSDNPKLVSASEILDPTPAPTDDHGDTRADATPLPTISGTEYDYGEIEESGDQDVFSFSTTSGHKYGIVVIPNGGAVDPEIRVFNSSGALIGSNSDIDGEPKAAGLTFTGNGGTYYVEVSGEGSSKGDYALGVTDYSDDTGGTPLNGGSDPDVDIDIPSVTWDYEGTDDDDKVSYLTSDTNNRYVATFDGEDTVRTGRGNDVILSGEDDDEVDAGGGNDTVYGDDGDDEIDGGDGDDGLLGGNGEDTIDGGDGDDTIGGQRHDDRIYGKDGNDILVGEDGDDYISGGDGNDSISGGDDEDSLYGGKDNDLIYGGENADTIGGDDGNDVLYGGDGQDFIQGGEGNDRIEGEDHDDDLRGNAGNDVILGGGGDDTIQPGSGDDVIDGESGSDWLDYSNEDGGAFIDMVNEIAFGAEIGSDTFNSIDHVTGTEGRDVIIGDNDDNILEGDRGNDRISGGAGNDSLEGGTGTNTAVFSGNRSDYTITASVDPDFQLQVVDNRNGSPDGTDLLDDMDYLEFADVTIRDDHALSTAPTALADAFETWSDRPAVFDVLANDTDPEGDALTIAEVTSLPTKGSTYILDNQLVFDPGNAFSNLGPGQRTSVEITYRATDGNGWFSEATAVIEVVAPPQPEVFTTGDDNIQLSTTGPHYARAGADKIIGTTLADTIFGNSGNDELIGRAGADLLDGGSNNDRLMGSAGDDVLRGQSGFDSLFGGRGRDELDGGKGDDKLFGQAGIDNFIFGTGYDRDVVSDYEQNIDNIVLDDALWGGKSLFRQQVLDKFAHDVGDHILFNFGNGDKLFIRNVENVDDLFFDLIIV